MSNGKGDTPRPLGVPREVFEENWERVFGDRRRRLKEELQEARLGVLKELAEEAQELGFYDCNKK